MTHEVRWQMPDDEIIHVREFPSQDQADAYRSSMIDTAERDGFEFSMDPEVYELVAGTGDHSSMAGNCS